MKQVLVRGGAVVVEDVPAPTVEAGTVLVRVAYSCISVGTELSGIRAASGALWQRALRNPDKVAKVLRSVASDGLHATRARVEGKLASAEATGYSAAGTVIEVGGGVTDLSAGDRVACAGAQAAHHAEVIRVPRNLTVRVPDGVDLATASSVTLGAIALQGVRRASPTLGETFVVIGLGIIGQLTAQILRAHGCRVIGVDLDKTRVALATQLGLDLALTGDEDEDARQVARLTDGVGADGVIITAATRSDAVVSSAFRMSRKKGRVVLVGDVGLALDRADFYAKEIDFLISSSYGPGRYDTSYEEEGLDYPIGYVRWTENRNMAAYLALLEDARIGVDRLLGARFPVEHAPDAYAALQGGSERPIAAVLEYPTTSETASAGRVVANPAARPGRAGTIRVGVIGAGSFARGMHLPNLRELSDHYSIRAVASRTGHNATTTAAQFGAAYATTEVDRVLEDPDVDLVLIATRHDEHASLALEALARGKHVLVEKPLALSQEEVDLLRAHFAAADETGPILLTGFNRRFSVHAARVLELVADRGGPMLLSYRMNAGYVSADHWTQTTQGGGRNRGEACHIYDLFTFLTGSPVADVQAQTVRPATAHYLSSDNFVATMRFEDGSLGTLAYTALGSPEHPKEQLDVFVDGRVVTLDDYRRVTVAGGKAKGTATASVQKGHREMLEALAGAIRGGGPWPNPLWQQLQATEIALAVEPSLRPAG